MKIAIIGSGNVGSTLGGKWSAAGHDVTFGVRDPQSEQSRQLATETNTTVSSVAEAATDADVVVLAVPFTAVDDAITAAGDLAGKTLIDTTNAVGNGYRPDVPLDTSGAETVSELAPRASVVKAFNSLGVGPLASLESGSPQAVTFMAGDDQAAKEQVRELGEELGFAEVVDVGPLAAAPLVESVALLWITLAYRQGLGPNFVFALPRT